MTNEIPEKAFKSITDLKQIVKNQKKLTQVTFGGITSSDNFKHVKEQLDIINSYRSVKGIEDLQPDKVAEDIVKLSASNVFASLVAGYLNGIVANDAEELKLIKSRAAFDIKAAKESLEAAGEKVRVTEKDILTLVRLKSEDAITELANTKTSAELLKFCYYSVRDFIEALKITLTRINK